MATSPITEIRHADSGDVQAVAALLGTAFLHSELGPWLIPHLSTRATVYPEYFALLAEQALNHGQVHTYGETTPTGVAVWYPITAGPPPAARDYPQRLAAITGPYAHRFLALDAALEHHHPYGEWHHYLALLAVHPDRQGQGIGGALLAHHHAELDRNGTPAYLEATNRHNARLYAEHGYRPRSGYHVGGDGPPLYPMWRPPTT